MPSDPHIGTVATQVTHVVLHSVADKDLFSFFYREKGEEYEQQRKLKNKVQHIFPKEIQEWFCHNFMLAMT